MTNSENEKFYVMLIILNITITIFLLVFILGTLGNIKSIEQEVAHINTILKENK